MDKFEELYKAEGFSKEIRNDLLKNKAMIAPFEAYYLFYYAKRIPKNGMYLELGSRFGGSLLCARKAIEIAGNGAKLISMDVSPSKELRDIVSNYPEISSLEGWTKNLLPLIADESIDLIFFDTDSKGDELKAGIRQCGRILKKGGLLLGHDWLIPGTNLGFARIAQAVKEFFDGKVKRIESTTLWLTTKKEILDAKEISG